MKRLLSLLAQACAPRSGAPKPSEAVRQLCLADEEAMAAMTEQVRNKKPVRKTKRSI